MSGLAARHPAACHAAEASCNTEAVFPDLGDFGGSAPCDRCDPIVSRLARCPLVRAGLVGSDREGPKGGGCRW